MTYSKMLAGLAALMAMLVLPAITNAQETETKDEIKPVAVETVDGKTIVNIAPHNTKIEFVGTHVGDDPKPRLGGFKTFEGVIGIDDNKITSIEVEMEITSVWTEFDNLTAHLMKADFFEAESFPKASFKSSSIRNLGEGSCTVAGELTLHGTASEIEFPVKFRVNDGAFALAAEFTLDRTRFGMDKMTDGVEKNVSLNVVVGQPTRGVESKAGNGSGSKEQASTDSTEMEGPTVTVNLPNMI